MKNQLKPNPSSRHHVDKKGDSSIIPSAILDDIDKIVSQDSSLIEKRHNILELEIKKMKVENIEDFTPRGR